MKLYNSKHIKQILKVSVVIKTMQQNNLIFVRTVTSEI